MSSFLRRARLHARRQWACTRCSRGNASRDFGGYGDFSGFLGLYGLRRCRDDPGGRQGWRRHGEADVVSGVGEGWNDFIFDLSTSGFDILRVNKARSSSLIDGQPSSPMGGARGINFAECGPE
jgi:hypothetical protein